MTVVLDASAVLALVFDERGADRVVALAKGSVLSAVNADEVMLKCAQRGIPSDLVAAQLGRLEIVVAPFDMVQAIVSSKLHPQLHKRGISFADRACLSLGIVTGKPVLTADAEWSALSLDVDIRLIR